MASKKIIDNATTFIFRNVFFILISYQTSKSHKTLLFPKIFIIMGLHFVKIKQKTPSSASLNFTHHYGSIILHLVYLMRFTYNISLLYTISGMSCTCKFICKMLTKCQTISVYLKSDRVSNKRYGEGNDDSKKRR